MRDIALKILRPEIAHQCPDYATAGSAAMDLRACLDGPHTLHPQETALIPTGIAFHIGNPNLAGLILPRSGLGHKHGVVLGNLMGLIDSDYQGEIMVSLWNRSALSYTVSPLERIAQLMFISVEKVQWRVVDSFDESTRGTGGFGSTGR